MTRRSQIESAHMSASVYTGLLKRGKNQYGTGLGGAFAREMLDTLSWQN